MRKPVRRIRKKRINYIELEGDLISKGLDNIYDMIGHGCNCHRNMGAGIALQIKRFFPEAFISDKLDRRTSIEKLGGFSMSSKTGRSAVVNIYSQFNGGANLDLEALTLALRKINMMFAGKSIGLPLIGCGIAGGDWKTIKKIIKKELIDMRVRVVIYKPTK